VARRDFGRLRWPQGEHGLEVKFAAFSGGSKPAQAIN